MSDLHSKIRSVIDRAADNRAWRQRECFNLILSETTPSLLFKMCEISDPAGAANSLQQPPRTIHVPPLMGIVTPWNDGRL